MKLDDRTEGLKGSELEGVRLEGDGLSHLREFWDRSARVDFIRAIDDRADEGSWMAAGRRDLELVRAALPGPSGSVLEIGCGTGRVLRHVAPLVGEAHGVDLSTEMVERAQKAMSDLDNVHVEAGNGYDLGAFEDGRFDLVYALAVFQHIPKTIVFNYLAEARRLLKPEGRVWFQVPNLMRQEHFSAFHHFTQPYFVEHPYPMHFYTPAEVGKLLVMAGFWIEAIDDQILVTARKAGRAGAAPRVEKALRLESWQLRGDPPPPSPLARLHL